jgi:heavy metal translocating P-type ATPase
VGVDVIALLAMAGALTLKEYLAGAMIALMLSGGEALEAYADRRARRELSSLLQRAPRSAHRYEQADLVTIPIEAVRPGDRLLVKPGEVIPVDGVLSGASAVVDESAMTGEAVPVEKTRGDSVRSGTVNAAAAFEIRAVSMAEDSTYAGIVRLVQAAGTNKAPFVRLADRYALLFLPFTLAISGAAWLISGDPVRALAVLVVATPCPLILAAPVAIVAGVSRAAARGVIIKGGGALETLARAEILIFDKTGTLTAGTPTVSQVEAAAGRTPQEILRYAASLDRVSAHVFASVLVSEARRQNLALTFPINPVEAPGRGLRGRVDGHEVALGKREWVSGIDPTEFGHRVARRSAVDGSSTVFIAIDGELAGAVVLADSIRTDTPRTVRALRRAGIRRVVMATGDHPEVALGIGEAIGADAVLAERSPEEKVETVRLESRGGITIMVGDGINDAAALAAADVGVAMGARGATATSEAADVVVLVDRLDRLAEAMEIARRSRRIALQSVITGMGLSVIAMGVAAAGLLVPIAGAVLQEVIDVAVILNALRALRPGKRRQETAAGALIAARFRTEHADMMPAVERIRQVADRLDQMAPAAALSELVDVERVIREQLLPHELAEDSALYPEVAGVLGGHDPTATMSRAHLEIRHLARRLAALIQDLPASGPAGTDLPDLRRVLYGLHAILRLHTAQEDEAYLSLFDDAVLA